MTNGAQMSVVRRVESLGDAGLIKLRTSGVMRRSDLAAGWTTAPAPPGMLVDHRSTLFAVLSDDLVRGSLDAGQTPAKRYPIALLLRPELLPLYAVLVALLRARGIRRGVFLSEPDAQEWLGRQAR